MDVLIGPQVDVEVGNTSKGESVCVSTWPGMTINDILEKLDLSNFTTVVEEDDQKLKDTKEYPIVTDLKVSPSQYPLVSAIVERIRCTY